MFARRLVPAADIRPCESTYACPDLWELSDGNFAVIGTDITSDAGLLPADAGCGPHERIVRIPRELLVRAKANIPNEA